MKGKIYKNKLTSATTNQHLNTDISSIYPPLYNQNISSQQPYSSGSVLLSPKNVNNNELAYQNNVFRRQSQNNRTFINQLFPQTMNGNNNNKTHNQVHSFIQQLGQQFTNTNNLPNQVTNTTNNNNRLLKRVLSNPNLTSYQFLVSPQNREDEADVIDQASILGKSSNSNSMYYHVPNNSSKVTQKGINNIFTNPKNIAHSPLTNHQKFNSTTPYNMPQGYPSPHNPLLQTSNIMYMNNQNSYMRPPIAVSLSDYITSYQKRHKQRVSALQSQHELEMQFYEEQLKTKDQTIEEMKRMLKEKEDIIKRLQSENASISSRSYISFANGNHYGKE